MSPRLRAPGVTPVRATAPSRGPSSVFVSRNLAQPPKSMHKTPRLDVLHTVDTTEPTPSPASRRGSPSLANLSICLILSDENWGPMGFWVVVDDISNVVPFITLLSEMYTIDICSKQGLASPNTRMHAPRYGPEDTRHFHADRQAVRHRRRHQTQIMWSCAYASRPPGFD